MGRRRISTKYRELYAGRKLDKALNECNNITDLQLLWRDYIEVARAERKARLINNSEIQLGCDRFIANIKASINGDEDLLNIVLLKLLQAEIELEKAKLERKGYGGIKTAEKKARK